MVGRFERFKLIGKELSEEAFKAYTGKKDYKRAIILYSLLAENLCIPNDVKALAKNMLFRLNKKFEENIQSAMQAIIIMGGLDGSV